MLRDPGRQGVFKPSDNEGEIRGLQVRRYPIGREVALRESLNPVFPQALEAIEPDQLRVRPQVIDPPLDRRALPDAELQVRNRFLQAGMDRLKQFAAIIDHYVTARPHGMPRPQRSIDQAVDHRCIIAALVLSLAGCSGSPTAPSPAPTTPPVVVVPPVVTPPVAPAQNPLLSDPRYSASFYRDFALGASQGGPYGLRRLTQAPRIYLRTVDDAGKAIDAFTLNETAAALINVAGSLTGAFGLAGLEQGTSTKEGQPGWVTVRWSDKPSQYCGFGYYAGDLMILYPQTAGCRCSGGPQVRLKTIKHELGHVLGFYHTDSPDDLMYTGSQSTCDKNPSDREILHAKIAYSQPLGSLDPR